MNKLIKIVGAAAALTAFAAPAWGAPRQGRTEVATVAPDGTRPDGPSRDHPDISADGRFVVFHSFARNLAATPAQCGPSPECESIYLRDRQTGMTTLVVATGSDYPPADGGYMLAFPSISADGRYIGFSAYTLPPLGYGDPTSVAVGAFNAWVYDRISGTTELVSRNSAGAAARPDPVMNGDTQYAVLATGSFATSLSADGRYVTFTSDGANLGGPIEKGHVFNVYRRDRVTGETRLVSTDEHGAPMSTNGYACTGRNLSGDGRYLAFSDALTKGDASSEVLEIRYVDINSGISRVISAPPAGVTPKGSDCPTISLDGTHVAFISEDALVPDDTNDATDVYEYDVASGRLTRVSVRSDGSQVVAPPRTSRGAGVIHPAVTLSANGRYAAFDSTAADLAPQPSGPPNNPDGSLRVYVHDLVTRTTSLASVSSTGESLAGDNGSPYISANGQAVAFMSTALAPPSGALPILNAPDEDVFVHLFGTSKRR
jgi:Tol biopolymer transport system component